MKSTRGRFATAEQGRSTWAEAPFLAAAATNGDDRIVGTGDDDRINARRGNDTVLGRGGDDELDGGDGDDVISGGKGSDFLLGGQGADRLAGGAGDDRLAGASGDDTVRGDAGRDTIDGDAGADRLFGGAGADLIFGEDDDDAEFGGAGRDELYGDAGNDSLDGGVGDDELEGDAGADTLTGGAGADLFKFFLGDFNPSSPFRSHDLVTDFAGANGDRLNLNGARAAFVGQSDFHFELGARLGFGGDGIAQLQYTYVGDRTVLVLDENDDGRISRGDFTLEFEGHVALGASDFIDTEFFRFGTPEADNLSGSKADDRIAGLGGDDELSGLAGDDILLGGDGNDAIYSGAGLDEISGGNGDDLLVINAFGSALGGEGSDTILGSDEFAAFNVLEGEGGDDRIYAGRGSANLVGGDGDDYLTGNVGSDSFEGGAGVDHFIFGRNWGQDFIQDFEDGAEKIDLRATGLAFEDLTIEQNDFGNTVISSDQGSIVLLLPSEQVTEADFLFG